VNAAVGSGAPFVEDDLEEALDRLRLALQFTELTAQEMTARSGGRVLFAAAPTGEHVGGSAAISAVVTSFAAVFAGRLVQDLTGSPVEIDVVDARSTGLALALTDAQATRAVELLSRHTTGAW
jgi:hypothetical protein